MSAIETGLTISGGSLSSAYVVKSSAFPNVYAVAAKIAGEGLENVVGVWGTNRTDGTGSFFADYGPARDFSDWGDGTARFNIRAFAIGGMTDDSVSVAQECAMPRQTLTLPGGSPP